MQYEDGMFFTTIDKDNDGSGANCALTNGGGGWWYHWCGIVRLTANPMIWMQYVATKTSRMMIKRQ